MINGEAIPQEFAGRFWSLLPAAASQLLEQKNSCLTFENSIGNSSFLQELQVSEEHSAIHLLDIGNRQYTLSFGCPGTGHLHFALPSKAFSKFVCFWFKTVLYSYILHSLSFKSSSKSLIEDEGLNVQYKSDEYQNGSPSGGLEISN